MSCFYPGSIVNRLLSTVQPFLVTELIGNWVSMVRGIFDKHFHFLLVNKDALQYRNLLGSAFFNSNMEQLKCSYHNITSFEKMSAAVE